MKHSPLVKKAINGDEAAFETLIKKESEKLYKTAFLYVKNKEDALDVLQETIYKAFISINQVKKPEYFYTWLTKILIRTAYELLRKRKKVIYDENLIHHKPETEGNQDVEAKMDLLNAISQLSEQYQTVIILFYYQDLPIHQIAETMGKPENTVKTYLRRAKKELKHYIEGVHHCGQRALS
ncbi:sigma-70 family RNA polymerase sigma factor [Sediminibacillus dalangtanensis]|uniref:Sigma-70 family RNA polymerase sigma factor n=1 Tax=Sediminibacillus dalangtanensis TaxID=2729421 RepID=A0ABX7W157_9BACI|nr:sigma-70 family RNA polymerase sigma factor [Sediminibacillus dalangtanensis]QTN01007.1 sigma-70 family RNA polymerase sigma factor [Sediminibacillus dalangtanensis]